MELGEYFSKTFGNMFHKDLYWPTFVATIIIGVILIVLAFIFLAPFIGDIMKLMTPGTSSVASYTDLMALAATMLTALTIFVIIEMYLYSVLSAFVIGKVDASESGTQTEFLHGFGSSFLTGLKLFGAHIVYFILVAIIFAIIWAISLIPVVGFVIGIILSILAALYLIVVCPTLIGKICTGTSFGESISSSFSLPFQKMHLVLYALVLLIVFGVLTLVLALLSGIPYVGFILLIFGMPLLVAYFLTMAYHFSKE